MTKQIIAALVITAATTIGGAFVAFNGWQWDLDALAADFSQVQRELIKGRIETLEDRIYDLEKEKERDPDSWNHRDDRRLEDLLDSLVEAESELDESK
jgi:hypothetical protein